ncbi:MAG: N-acetylneuraminate synthase family protein [Flavobacteriaceae bacterium]
MNTIKTKFNQISNQSLYFIADIGANHDGSLEKAIQLIHLAKEAGADAAKFQNFSANKIVSKYEFDNMPRQSHQASWSKSVFEVYEEASINQNWTKILKEECDKIGIDYFTSPYDFNAVDLVNEYVDIFKIGSGDITWLEIIDYIISKNKPVLIATGASSLDDVDRAMNRVLAQNAKHVLMQCNTNYTGSEKNFDFINLNVLKTYKEKYPNTILGLSDHTSGHSTVLGSIALGATVIEKHFTDNNANVGPDHFFAMNPKSWREMVDCAKELFRSLGDGYKKIEENELDSYKVQRRSLCASKGLKKHTILTKDHLVALRPHTDNSYHPYEIDNLIGKVLKSEISQSQSIKKDDIEP